jgi:hypothetical protein
MCLSLSVCLSVSVSRCLSLDVSTFSCSQIDAPLFVTWYQCVVTVAWCYVFGALRDAHPRINHFPKFSYDLSVAKKVCRAPDIVILILRKYMLY